MATLYAQHLNDAVVLDAGNDIESLAASLSQKVWQKIMILDAARGRGTRAVGGSVDSRASPFDNGTVGDHDGAMTDPKPRPNHSIYLRVLRQMSPAARLRKAFELSAFTRKLFRAGLRRRFPRLDEEALDRIVRERLARCHNRNY